LYLLRKENQRQKNLLQAPGKKKEMLMTDKWLAVIGTWILCDGLFSLHCYWGKEGWKENYIRLIRMFIGLILIFGG